MRSRIDAQRARGEFALLGEAVTPHEGFSLSEPGWDRYLAMAEELGIPMGIQMGLEPSGRSELSCDFEIRRSVWRSVSAGRCAGAARKIARICAARGMAARRRECDWSKRLRKTNYVRIRRDDLAQQRRDLRFDPARMTVQEHLSAPQ